MAIAAEDVCLERVLPMDEGFALEEVVPETGLPTLGSDVTFQIVSPDANLLVQLPFGSQTQTFLREVRKCCGAGVVGKEDCPPEGETWPGSSKGQSVAGGAPRPSKLHREGTSDALVSSKTLDRRGSTLRSQLLQKEDLYTFLCCFKFFVGSYNVNGQSPQESLLPWLSHDPEPPDVYCVGFQALDPSREAAVFHDTPREEEWFKAVTKSLHPGAKYATIKLVRRVGILLLLCVRRELAANISDVGIATVGSLVGMGDKGAVAIHFRFHSTTICMVNAHLAAHPQESEQQNQDFHDICARLQFYQQDPSLPAIPLSQHDVIVWLGDLNYRLEEQDIERVKKLIDAQDICALYQYDQLKNQMEAKRVFEDFTEGEINFQPTYKYKAGSDEWDTSERCCAFAWCDRILFKGKTISQLSYRSHMSLRNSDHKPVSAVFSIGVKVVDEQLYRKVFEETVSSLDKMENASIPSVTLSKREFFFRDVKFMQLQMEFFIICNGPIPCQFEFICKPHESSYCKPWLIAKPSKGFLLPDAEVTVELEVFVNKSTATHLNSGEDHLEDILVLHLDRGKDYFLSVSGNYLPSCFGSPIQALTHMRQPIQDMLPEAIRNLTLMPLWSGEDFFWDEKPLDIPKELWMMVDHLCRSACQQKDLFQQPGLRAEFPEIRDCLDTGTLDTFIGSSSSVAEALLLFLESLPEPVICYQLYDSSVERASSFVLSSQVVSMLPTCHKNVFRYLMAFLRELLQHSGKNHLDGNILASVFGPVLLRPPPGRPVPDPAEKQKAQQFIQQFLLLEGSSH
ncbi:type II inositol 1,4,5-trisphosphate 5-phosphatase isoform X2 [Python bivittatus]|uniref:phosphoinositide 5-phosphatase n=1 Tax=Python bivittatus TaxID=176946 RepID=A0A9F5MWP1_PYTBI|nr:type II inositol 1,4,5-trisphosphate 5-phosphatase isoform X2 [Python bivittatus]